MAATTTPVSEYLSRHQKMLSDRAPWDTHFQDLAEAYLTRKANFTKNITPGEFLNDDLFDNTGQFAAMLFASVIFSLSWPDTTRAFRLKPARWLTKTPGINELFKHWNEEMWAAIDNPRAGFHTAMSEFFLEYGIFGTSGVGAFEGPEEDISLPVVFSSWSIKNICIAENAQGFVDTIYVLEEKTVRQVVQEYGLASVHAEVAKLYNEEKYEEKMEVLKLIEPRKITSADKDKDGNLKEGNLSLPFRSLYIDVKNKHIMKESGLHEFPVAVGRAAKVIGEVFGRSCGMTALPDVNTLNVITEGILGATEKQLDPPLAVLDDGRLGGGVIDTSAGGINVFNTSGRISGDKVVTPLYTVGELTSAKDLQEVYKLSITQAFYLDRLLDLNNQVQMTAYETSIRNRMRGEALASLFARIESEVYTPLIGRVFNILFRRGYMGVGSRTFLEKVHNMWKRITGAEFISIPDQVMKAVEAGLDVFEIEYISPAKRFMQSEKLQGHLNVADFIVTVGPIVPGILDAIDEVKLARGVATYNGVGEEVLRPEDEIEDLRKAKGVQAENEALIEAGKGVSEVARNFAQAKGGSMTGKK